MKKQYKKGFTLIELLIVIALLGALAVGLLAALDPFEQLKKGTDAGVRNTAIEFQGAYVRFYSIKNFGPGCKDSAGADAPCDGTNTAIDTGVDGVADPLSTLPNTIKQIADAGELKKDFISLAGSGQLAKIFSNYVSSTQSISVCFTPSSKSLQRDPNTKYNPDHTGALVTDGSCFTQGGTTACDYCIQ